MISNYTTFERNEPNWWWVWSDGNYLRTSEVVTLLNDQNIIIKECHEVNLQLTNALLEERNKTKKLEDNVKTLIQLLLKLKKYQKEVEKTNQEFRNLIYCYENGIL